MKRLLTLLLISALIAPHFACTRKKKLQQARQQSDRQTLQECLALSKKKKFQDAIECLEVFKSRFPQSQEALEAELQIADNYFNNKEWVLAGETYRLFAELNPNSPKADYAYYRAGLAYAGALPKKIDRDISSLKQAQNSFAQVFSLYPASPYSQMAQEKYDELRSRSAERNLYVGKFYFKRGEYRAAVPRMIAIMQDYPGLGFDEDALYYLAIAYDRLEMPDKAQAAVQLMQEKFPNSSKTKRVSGKILGGS